MHIGRISTADLGRTASRTLVTKPVLNRIFEQEFKALCSSDSSAVSASLSVDTSAMSSTFIEEYSTPIVNVDFNIKELQDLALSNGYFDLGLVHAMDVSPLFKDVTTRIIMLDTEHTFAEALAVIEPFIEQLGPNFYGALLRSGSTIINPYHPLTALAMTDGNSKRRYKIVIYIYDNREKLDITYQSAIISTEQTEEYIRNLLVSVGTRIDTPPVDAVTVYKDINERQYSVKQYIGIYSSPKIVTSPNARGSVNVNLTTQQAMLVAHQVIARGTIAPYYGTSILFRPNSQSKTRGTALTPCKSVNISSSQSGFSEVLRGSVCTGSTNGITLKSLAVLNHANLGSAYNRDVLTFGSLRYFDQCIFAARTIYKLAGFITAEVQHTNPHVPDYPAIVTDLTAIIDSDTYNEFRNRYSISSAAIQKALDYATNKGQS